MSGGGYGRYSVGGVSTGLRGLSSWISETWLLGENGFSGLVPDSAVSFSTSATAGFASRRANTKETAKSSYEREDIAYG